MPVTETVEIVVDLEQPEAAALDHVSQVMTEHEATLKAGGAIQVRLVGRRPGQPDKLVEYTLTPDVFLQTEQDVVFPKVVESILAKELPPKVARNEKLRQHVINELKKDPYWSTQVVELVKQLQNR